MTSAACTRLDIALVHLCGGRGAITRRRGWPMLRLRSRLEVMYRIVLLMGRDVSGGERSLGGGGSMVNRWRASRCRRYDHRLRSGGLSFESFTAVVTVFPERCIDTSSGQSDHDVSIACSEAEADLTFYHDSTFIWPTQSQNSDSKHEGLWRR